MNPTLLQLPNPWIDYSTQGYAKGKKPAVPESAATGLVLVGLCVALYLIRKRRTP